MGDASLRFDNEMFARNMLLSSGKELMLTAGSSPYFSVLEDGGLLEGELRRGSDCRRPTQRGWHLSCLEYQPGGATDVSAAACSMVTTRLQARPESIRATYDAGAEVLLGCTEWSMPRLMSNPLPMEFSREGDTILQRFEEDDNVRVIHMAEGSSGAVGKAQSALGYCDRGRWDGDSLVDRDVKRRTGTTGQSWHTVRCQAAPDGALYAG